MSTKRAIQSLIFLTWIGYTVYQLWDNKEIVGKIVIALFVAMILVGGVEVMVP